MYRKIKITKIKFKKQLKIIHKPNVNLEVSEITNNIKDIDINNTEIQDKSPKNQSDDNHYISIFIIYMKNKSYLQLLTGKPHVYSPIIDNDFRYKKNIKNEIKKCFKISNDNIDQIKHLETIQNNHVYCVYLKNKMQNMRPLFVLPNTKKDYFKQYNSYNLNINSLFRLVEHKSK